MKTTDTPIFSQTHTHTQTPSVPSSGFLLLLSLLNETLQPSLSPLKDPDFVCDRETAAVY